ncbi:unnamed protein product [Pedinophyceae sp. YPF-701]|nr:unnamed protein product [Pedinophyceae sp. YPF-701]
MDIYVPRGGEGQGKPHGIALFVHGGVWSTGEAWHYAPMAKQLADAGIVTCVMTYTLYPEALVPEMVREVERALDYVMDHAEKYGADRGRVSLVGHSAGAQLCTMALISRARQRAKTKRDAPMPAQLVSLCGVFDIGRHYIYEEARGVETLSTMHRAVGGVIEDPSVWSEATREKHHSQSPAAILSDLKPDEHDWLQYMPPVYLASSFADDVVPMYETIDMHMQLRSKNVPAELLCYNKVGHADFVTAWPGSKPPSRPPPTFVRDLVGLLSMRAKPHGLRVGRRGLLESCGRYRVRL